MSLQFHKQKILALILAGGAGGRLGLLTEKRAKPVMPFAGFYRLIDFALSNCRHSGINDVWVVEQYELNSLNEHLSNGRPWDLDRTYGGLQVLPPSERSEKKRDEKGGFAEGNADAIFRQLDLIREFAPDIVVVLSADHVYKMDFRDAIHAHIERKADLTMVTTRLPKGETASRFGVVEVLQNGRVKNFDYKPDRPKNDLITTEIFVYDAPVLLDALQSLKNENGALNDYGHELIPHLVAKGSVFEHRLEGYWRDVGTIKSYWQSQIDLLDSRTKFIFDDEAWPILTLASQRVPAFIYGSAEVKDSLVAQGCRVFGRVSRSVLSSGVIVEKEAVIEDSILLPGAEIEKGAKIRRAVIDAGVKLTRKKAAQAEAARGKNKNAIVVVGKYKIQSSDELSE
jgi:glucose-1-phosphate adenylyltransferase